MRTARTTALLGALLLVSPTIGAQQIPDSTVARPSVPSVLSVPQSPTVVGRAPGAYMNISFVGLIDAGWSTARDLDRLEVGDHDPRVRGFTIPNAELFLDGAVDPYFRGFVNIVHKLDAGAETGVELEEMYFLTTSLPGNLQLKGGQFFSEFGRQNSLHPHGWAFADQLLVIGRMFGAEALRSQGVRLAWLLPTAFYAEASLAMMNSAGGTTASFRSEESGALHGGVVDERVVSGGQEMLYVPRFTTSVDLTDTQTLLAGVSAALGPNNSGPDARTQIIGADVYWKWKSSRAQKGFPFVAVQVEALARRYDAAERVSAANAADTLPAELLKDVGAYGQLQWGIRPLVVAAIRVESVRSNDPAPPAFVSDERGARSRYSTNLTWFPTEFSKFRVQYNYDHRNGLGNDHSLWMQFEFLLGAHAAHKF